MKAKREEKLARLEVVSKLYKRGYNYRQINAEVKKRVGLKTYSLWTTKKDIDDLLEEWRENRLNDIDKTLQLELERIDDTCRELWEQWEKSKESYEEVTQKRKGTPRMSKESGIQTTSIEEHTRKVLGLGDPRYIAEIRMQLAERRKLLGLYAPEKKEIGGELSFANLLIESGMLEEAENTINQAETTQSDDLDE